MKNLRLKSPETIFEENILSTLNQERIKMSRFKIFKKRK